MTDQTAFRVDDMTCGHCESTIRKALAQRLPDSEIDIDLKSHIVRVGGDAETARQAIEKAGYTPQPA